MLTGAAKLYHAAHTRRVPRRVCAASGKVATEFQSDSSRTDSPVRILHAQPRSPLSLSVAHIRHLKKFTTFYTVSATKARAAASRGVALARTISSVPRLALRQKAVRRSHRLRHGNWVIGSRCGRNSFSSGTTSVLRAVFASRDEPMASAPALPEATVSGQFVQIFGRKENPRGGDVLVKVRHR